MDINTNTEYEAKYKKVPVHLYTGPIQYPRFP
jgi:hypothetical protein